MAESGRALLVASSEADRTFRRSVPATAESRALVSFRRGHASESGTASVAHLHSEIAGFPAEIARDVLFASSATGAVIGQVVVATVDLE